MKRFCLVLSLILFSSLSYGISHIPDSIDVKIKKLVTCIDESDVQIAKKEKGLRELAMALDSFQSDSEQKYLAIFDLGRDYSAFVADSALFYFEKAFVVAENMGRDDLVRKVRLYQARTMVTTGYYMEAYSLLSDIKRSDVPEDCIVTYYLAMTQLYKSVSQQNISRPSLYEEYLGKYVCYRDSLLSVLPADSPLALRYRERKAAEEGRFEEAFDFNSRRRDILGPKLYENALVFYDRYALVCHFQGCPIEDAIGELLTSAIIDVSRVNQDMVSLLYVEKYLSDHNRFDEAKKVSDYYYSTMTRFGSMVRQVAGFNQSMAINNEYLCMLSKNRHRLVAALAIVSFLIIALLVVFLYVVSARRKLSILNEKLVRSDKVAKTYMTHFFCLYSSYIESMTAFKKRICTMLHKGQVENAIRITAPSKENESEELREMVNNFDSAFISVYKNYVEEFNSMLREEFRITPMSGELMTNELRIFALIKMGVEDSREISNTLHLSIKTVYNKRYEIKNKLLVPYGEFLRRLSEI